MDKLNGNWKIDYGKILDEKRRIMESIFDTVRAHAHHALPPSVPTAVPSSSAALSAVPALSARSWRTDPTTAQREANSASRASWQRGVWGLLVTQCRVCWRCQEV